MNQIERFLRHPAIAGAIFALVILVLPNIKDLKSSSAHRYLGSAQEIAGRIPDVNARVNL